MSNLIEQNNRFLRQMDFADPAKFRQPVTILGVGSVGSAAAIALGKMGLRLLTLIDFDVFETHNVANQLCLEKEHLGKLKVHAISDLMEQMSPPGLKVDVVPGRLTGTKITTVHDGRVWDGKSLISGILVNCPDDMAARKDAWNLCKFNPRVPYVIDVRMAAQFLKLYIVSTMKLEQIKRYEESLYSNEEASEDPCGMRAIIYTSLVAGALVAKFIKNIQLGEPVPEEYEMDLHTGTILQVVKGRQVASREEHALAFVG